MVTESEMAEMLHCIIGSIVVLWKEKYCKYTVVGSSASFAIGDKDGKVILLHRQRHSIKFKDNR